MARGKFMSMTTKTRTRYSWYGSGLLLVNDKGVTHEHCGELWHLCVSSRYIMLAGVVIKFQNLNVVYNKGTHT